MPCDDLREVHDAKRVLLGIEADGEPQSVVVGEPDQECPGAQAEPDLLEKVAGDPLEPGPEVRLEAPHELRDRIPHGHYHPHPWLAGQVDSQFISPGVSSAGAVLGPLDRCFGDRRGERGMDPRTAC